MVVLDDWPPYRGGRLSRLDCNEIYIYVKCVDNMLIMKFTEVLLLTNCC